ncbi:unnamed protein product [Mytilus coruscus]|uniref:Tyr recombinase domain-containing protein n=1 Tax=Mytilus coruscus TaxID=42192 RepID=A0A6J8A7T8_MYTCO|nr:unnamed protein product [Mytilus coruscus]
MSVGKHPAIIHHMRAIFNVRTPLPRYQSSWDVDKVLSCITGWGDNSSLSMKILVQKLTMLLALTSAGRVSEIHKLNLDFMCDKGDHIIFQIPSLTKTCRPGKTKPELKFYKFEDNNLCVVECLRKYLELTEKIRDTNDRLNRNWLLLSFVKPHHPVTTSTLARWLKSVISSAGIDTANYKAHSTRSACTSKAFRAGVSSSEIMKQARWSNLTTFSRFYYKPLAGSDFQKAVLIR